MSGAARCHKPRGRRENVEEGRWLRVYRIDALTRQQGRCAYCQCPLTVQTATADHDIPRTAGGPTSAANIVAACVDCNQAKGSWYTGAQFLRIIKSPPSGCSNMILMTWSRRRIWVRTWRACARIRAAAGLA